MHRRDAGPDAPPTNARRSEARPGQIRPAISHGHPEVPSPELLRHVTPSSARTPVGLCASSQERWKREARTRHIRPVRLRMQPATAVNRARRRSGRTVSCRAIHLETETCLIPSNRNFCALAVDKYRRICVVNTRLNSRVFGFALRSAISQISGPHSRIPTTIGPILRRLDHRGFMRRLSIFNLHIHNISYCISHRSDHRPDPCLPNPDRMAAF